MTAKDHVPTDLSIPLGTSMPYRLLARIIHGVPIRALGGGGVPRWIAAGRLVWAGLRFGSIGASGGTDLVATIRPRASWWGRRRVIGG